MKVTLLEDRIGRMEQFSEFDLKKEQSIFIITNSELTNLISDLDNNSTDKLNDYECIIMHRSAFTNSQRDVIKAYCKKNKKHLVFFSGGISSSIYNDSSFPFLHINSKDFYSNNLRLFIDEIESQNNLNLLILQFGYRWKLNLLLSLRDELNVMIQRDKYPKRIRELNINNLIKSELINKFSLAWLKKEGIESISNEEVDDFKSKVDQLIIESI